MLQGLKDPEAKRKAIGAEFIRVFQDFADDFREQHGVSPKCAFACSATPEGEEEEAPKAVIARVALGAPYALGCMFFFPHISHTARHIMR